MLHKNGDCPNVHPESDDLCPICNVCSDKDCIREKTHTGFCWAKDDLPVSQPPVSEWEKEFDETWFKICDETDEYLKKIPDPNIRFTLGQKTYDYVTRVRNQTLEEAAEALEEIEKYDLETPNGYDETNLIDISSAQATIRSLKSK